MVQHADVFGYIRIGYDLARRYEVSRRLRKVSASLHVGGFALARDKAYASGLRSLLIVRLPSTRAWSGTVPRPLNGSSTKSPGCEYRWMK